MKSIFKNMTLLEALALIFVALVLAFSVSKAFAMSGKASADYAQDREVKVKRIMHTSDISKGFYEVKLKNGDHCYISQSSYGVGMSCKFAGH